MKKYSQPKAFVDKLHKGFVLTCVGLTCYGLFLLGLRAERYFTVIRPQRKLLDEQAKKELLSEGRSDRNLLNAVDTTEELKY